jgi:hypothetical protein
VYIIQVPTQPSGVTLQAMQSMIRVLVLSIVLNLIMERQLYLVNGTLLLNLVSMLNQDLQVMIHM